jgi:ppGpp synthetase/RelA/SpoT-type nucleotidyltranferase
MPPPFSGNQLAKLGRRLAQPGPISDEDYEILAEVAEAYQAVLDKVEERLGRLGYQATTRVKTTGTLVDKLRRTPQIAFGSIHDVAGARIVIDGGRWEQDQVIDRILGAFADCPKAPQKIDRRAQPSHGYRAVHVIVFVDSTPVEIQVRTKLQDTWAQVTEKLGDTWGRWLRYGEEPDQLDTLLDPGNPESWTRRKLVETLNSTSDAIHTIEAGEHQVAAAEHQLTEVKTKVAAAVESAQVLMDTMLTTVKRWEGPK